MKFILDYDNWICGKPDSALKKEGNYVGSGRTALYNSHGRMCCLGQFMECMGVSKYDMAYKETPSDVEEEVDFFINSKGDNSLLSEEAMAINDDTDISVSEKVRRLKELFSEYDHEIELVNFPKNLSDGK